MKNFLNKHKKGPLMGPIKKTHKKKTHKETHQKRPNKKHQKETHKKGPNKKAHKKHQKKIQKGPLLNKRTLRVLKALWNRATHSKITLKN